jgi:hypothetical protein
VSTVNSGENEIFNYDPDIIIRVFQKVANFLILFTKVYQSSLQDKFSIRKTISVISEEDTNFDQVLLTNFFRLKTVAMRTDFLFTNKKEFIKWFTVLVDLKVETNNCVRILYFQNLTTKCSTYSWIW